MMCAFPECRNTAKHVCAGCDERFCKAHKHPREALSVGDEHASDAHWAGAIYDADPFNDDDGEPDENF